MPESVRRVFQPSTDAYAIANALKSNAFRGHKTMGHHPGNTVLCGSEDLMDIGRNFIYTEVGSGATAGVIQAPTSTLPARAKFTTGGTQHNNQQIQWAKAQTASATAAGTPTAFAPFLIKADPVVAGQGGCSIHMRFRLRITTTINNAAFFCGIAVVTTTLFSASAPNFTDGVGFYKAAGAATVAGVEVAGSSTTTVVLANNTLAANTFYILDCLIKENLSVTWWINGVETGDATGSSVLPANTVALAPSFVVSAGTAAAATAEMTGLVVSQDSGFAAA